jgi:hypothetical protein
VLPRFLLFVSLLLATAAEPIWAYRPAEVRGQSPYIVAGTTHVKGYYRKDGTYVHPHERKSPSSSSTKKPPTVRESITRTPSHVGSDGIARDSHGRIERSEAAKHEFMKMTGYPHGRPGYVVDHIIPLARGGADDPSNMQWQTIEESKLKDKVELGPHPRSGNHR